MILAEIERRIRLPIDHQWQPRSYLWPFPRHCSFA